MKLRMLVRGIVYVVAFCVLSVFRPLDSESGSTSVSELDRPAATASTAYTATGFKPVYRIDSELRQLALAMRPLLPRTALDMAPFPFEAGGLHQTNKDRRAGEGGDSACQGSVH